jgi:hypothetical protein
MINSYKIKHTSVGATPVLFSFDNTFRPGRDGWRNCTGYFVFYQHIVPTAQRLLKRSMIFVKSSKFMINLSR